MPVQVHKWEMPWKKLMLAEAQVAQIGLQAQLASAQSELEKSQEGRKALQEQLD